MMRFLLLLFPIYLLVSGCSSLELATPFNQLQPIKSDARYLVVVTYTEYKPQNKTQFNDSVEQIIASLENIDGLHGYSIRKDFLSNKAWTYTIWEAEAAMTSFKASGPHIQAISAAPQLLESAKFARTYLTGETLPFD